MSYHRMPTFGLAASGLLLLVAGCGASVQRVLVTPEIRLRQLNPVFVSSAASSGTLSFSGGRVAGLVAGSASDGDREVARALESFAFDLMTVGFTLSSDSSQAVAVAELSIGSIRYDPLAGWIADQALVRFRRRSDGAVLAFYRADAQAITPTTRKLLGALTAAIRRDY